MSSGDSSAAGERTLLWASFLSPRRNETAFLKCEPKKIPCEGLDRKSTWTLWGPQAPCPFRAIPKRRRASSLQRGRSSCWCLWSGPGPIFIQGSVGCVGLTLNPTHRGSNSLLRKLGGDPEDVGGRRAGRQGSGTQRRLYYGGGLIFGHQTPLSGSLAPRWLLPADSQCTVC